LPKLVFAILLITVTISGLALASNIYDGIAQASTPVNGIITQDTTWTKTNIILSLLTIKLTNAQSLPVPDVPEFTIRLVNNSYSTQPTTITTTDPYTGKQTVLTTPSQYVKDEYIEVSIENQAFTPYTITYRVDNRAIDDRSVNLYFNVISKGHFSNSWDVQEADGSDSGIESDYASHYTIIKLFMNSVPSPAQIDFKVQAVIGYLANQYEPEEHLPPPAIHDPNFVITGTTSNWSSPQTLKIPANNISPGSTVPEFTAIAILPLALLVLAVIAFRLKKTMHCRL
jgi:hypothetical protein